MESNCLKVNKIKIMNNVKIKFKNGKITCLKPLNPNNKPQKYLEQITGLKYGSKNKDLYAQTVGMITSYICCHSPQDSKTPKVLISA